MKPINIDKLRTKYTISNTGIVYSNWRNRYLKPQFNSVGYTMVYLTDTDKNSKWYMIHRLVAVTYIGQPENNSLEVNHIDNIKANNHYFNLEWVTHSENIIKSYATTDRGGGRRKGTKHTAITKRKLSEAKKQKIILYNTISGNKTKFNSIQELINNIGINRRTYNRHMTGYKHYKFIKCAVNPF